MIATRSDSDGWLDAYRADIGFERSEANRLVHAQRVRRFARFFASPLFDADTGDVAAWLTSLQVGERSGDQYLGSLCDFYEWARRKGLVEANPAQPLRRRPYRWRPPQLTTLPNPARPVPIAQAVDAYLWDRHGRGELNARSVRGLADRLRLLVAAFGPDRPVGELDRAGLADWQRSIGAHAPASRRAYLSAVKTFCGWAVEAGYLEADPTARLRPIREPRRVPRALSRAQVRQLLDCCAGSARDTAVVWLMVGCGLRAGEIAGAHFGNWNREERTLAVTGKGAHERLLPVPAAPAAALEAYLDEVGRYDGPLIRSTSRYGQPGHEPLTPAAVSVRLTKLMYRAGIKASPGDRISGHALRHTCASDVLDRCGNVRTVQAVLGHASLATTEIYLRRADLGAMREALEGRDYQADSPVTVTPRS